MLNRRIRLSVRPSQANLSTRKLTTGTLYQRSCPRPSKCLHSRGQRSRSSHLSIVTLVKARGCGTAGAVVPRTSAQVPLVPQYLLASATESERVPEKLGCRIVWRPGMSMPSFHFNPYSSTINMLFSSSFILLVLSATAFALPIARPPPNGAAGPANNAAARPAQQAPPPNNNNNGAPPPANGAAANNNAGRPNNNAARPNNGPRPRNARAIRGGAAAQANGANAPANNAAANAPANPNRTPANQAAPPPNTTTPPPANNTPPPVNNNNNNNAAPGPNNNAAARPNSPRAPADGANTPAGNAAGPANGAAGTPDNGAATPAAPSPTPTNVATAPTSGSGSNGAATSGSGSAAIFTPGTGACGTTNAATDKVVAIPAALFGTGEFCGKTLTITNPATGEKTTATVEDECTSCATGDIELSNAVFQNLGTTDTSALSVSWDLD